MKGLFSYLAAVRPMTSKMSDSGNMMNVMIYSASVFWRTIRQP